MTTTLTHDQKIAQDAIYAFLCDPVEQVFVLAGYSGTGKSTLIKTVMAEWPQFCKTAKLVNPTLKELPFRLTATTNKAAENFEQITNKECRTIHSFLGLRVVKNYETGRTYLRPKSNEYVAPSILIIDEASYIDSQLLEKISKKTHGSKVIFVGDPAQLTPVKSNRTPVFDSNFTGAHLSEVVRQAKGNPIMDLATKFRETVGTGSFFSFKPDGNAITHLNREDFDDAVLNEFSRNDWSYQDSKFLAWTNKTVINYNNAIHDRLTGSPIFKIGDYAVCNNYLNLGNNNSIKTDELVQISSIEPTTDLHGVDGNYMTLNKGHRVFVPHDKVAVKKIVKTARATGDIQLVQKIEDSWADLRAAYACTINKSQGSTYDKVFIDLDDISKCNDGNQIARMLYVGVSRARHKVYLTGDLV